MAAPKTPNMGPAEAAKQRKGDLTAVRRLRANGWLVFPPEVLALLPADTVARLKQLAKGT